MLYFCKLLFSFAIRRLYRARESRGQDVFYSSFATLCCQYEVVLIVPCIIHPSTGPRNSRAGCIPGPSCSRAGSIVSLFLLQARGIRGRERIGPRNSRAGKCGHSSDVRSFIISFFIPAGPEGGLARPLDGCTGADARPTSTRCLRTRGGLPPDACECAKVADSTRDVCRIGLRRARESRKIIGVRGIGIEPDRTEPNNRDGLRNWGLHAVPSVKLPAAPGQGKLRYPSMRPPSCKSGRGPKTVQTPFTPPHSGI